MKNDKSRLFVLLTTTTIAGNILFVLWILYNGINENFEARMVEKTAYVALMLLLSINSILLIRKRK